MIMATATKKPVHAHSDAAPHAGFETPDFAKGFAAVTAPVAEMQEALRQTVEKSVEQTRAAYAKAKTSADEASSAVEASMETAKAGVIAINAKAIDAVRAHAEANFNFLKSAFASKTVADFVALQGEFARKQFEAFTGQSKEIATLAQKVANDSVEPIKSQFAKTFKVAV
jgi:phasin